MCFVHGLRRIPRVRDCLEPSNGSDMIGAASTSNRLGDVPTGNNTAVTDAKGNATPVEEKIKTEAPIVGTQRIVRVCLNALFDLHVTFRYGAS